MQNGVPAYVMAAVGTAVIVTDVVTGTAAQPADAGMLYVTLLVRSVVLRDLISFPARRTSDLAVDEYVPPVYAPVPVKVTGSAVASEIQNGVPAYVMAAVGTAVIVTDVVTGTAAQPADAGMLYVTV